MGVWNRLFSSGAKKEEPKVVQQTQQDVETRSANMSPSMSVVTASNGSMTYDEFLDLINSTSNGFQIPAFRSAVDKITRSIARMPMKVYSVDQKTGRKTQVFDHPVCRLLKRPNQIMGYTALMQYFMEDMFKSRGEGYLMIKRDSRANPIAIVNIRQEDVTNVPDDYNTPTQNTYFYQGVPYDHFKMIHVMNYSEEFYQGYSLGAYNSQMIDTANQAEYAANQDLATGGNVSAIAAIHGRPDQKRLEKIRNSINKVGQDGKSLMIVEAEKLSVSTLSTSAKDRQLVETRQHNALDIARFFQIPPQLLGAGEFEYKTREELDTAFLNECLLFWIKKIEDEFNKTIFKPSEIDRYVVQIDHTDFVSPDWATRGDVIYKGVSCGALSPNDASEEMGWRRTDDESADQRFAIPGSYPINVAAEMAQHSIDNKAVHLKKDAEAEDAEKAKEKEGDEDKE